VIDEVLDTVTTEQIMHTIRDAHTRLPFDLITEQEDGE
jgi:hypothetical protein